MHLPGFGPMEVMLSLIILLFDVVVKIRCQLMLAGLKLSNLSAICFSFYSEGRATPSSAKPEQPESLPAKEVELSSLKNEQLSMDPSEERLYLLLNNQLTRQKLVPSAILLFLEKSSDPAKLVLDLIKGYVHQQLNKEQIGFEESFLRWSTLLLKQLKQISPSIGPKEREDAMKLAIDLKLNMRNDTNGSMDAVVFLLLIVSYGLTTSFSGDEILKLFENVVLHEQASELCLMFGYNQKIQG